MHITKKMFLCTSKHNTMIISVHIPKTAGRSFRSLLQTKFESGFRDDYKDSPLNKKENERIENCENFKKEYRLYKKFLHKLKKTECIHGHFLPYKYNSHLSNKNDQFVTWLREPTERLISHYFYRKKVYQETVETPNQKIFHDYGSFEEFCFSEKMQNAYDKYLYKFPIENFSFIGIVEHFEEDLKYFSQNFLNTKIEDIPRKGTNSYKDQLSCLEDTDFIKKIKEFHSKDYSIYENALNIRKKRIL